MHFVFYRCKDYPQLNDPTCIAVPDPSDPTCCMIPKCDNPTNPLIPTGFQGTITGSQTPAPPTYVTPAPFTGTAAPGSTLAPTPPPTTPTPKCKYLVLFMIIFFNIVFIVIARLCYYR